MSVTIHGGQITHATGRAFVQLFRGNWYTHEVQLGDDFSTHRLECDTETTLVSTALDEIYTVTGYIWEPGKLSILLGHGTLCDIRSVSFEVV